MRSAVCIILLGLVVPVFCARVTKQLVENTNPVVNPERGLFGLCPLTQNTDLSTLRQTQETTLCYGPILLAPFRTALISNSTLTTINTQLASLPSAGLKVVVRILYDDTATGNDTSLFWIQQHLIQLRPVFEANTAVIAWFQAGIIGAWGEWHSSVNNLDSPSNRQAVWNLLVQHLPPFSTCSKIQIRRPDYAVLLEPTINGTTPQNNSTCNGARRIAHHNDCWLASASDMGTYQLDGQTSEFARSYWLNFLERSTANTVWGGETCAVSAYSHCNHTALVEAKRLHATFLNYLYQPDVIAALQAEGCWDTFKSQLGFRYTVNNLTYDSQVAPQSCYAVNISLVNKGWSRAHIARPVLIGLLASNGHIAIDGNFADWSGSFASPVVTDPSGDQAGAVTDIRAVWLASDSQCLFVKLQFTSTISSPFFEVSYHHIFIDTDNNPATGNQGSELMIEGSTAYDQRNGGWNEGAVNGQPLTYAEGTMQDGTRVVEACIPLSWTYAQDGSSVFPTGQAVVGLTVGASTTSWSQTETTQRATVTLRSITPPTVVASTQVQGQAGDVREWLPDTPVSIQESLFVPALAANFSQLSLFMSLPDAASTLSQNPLFSVQFANAGVWDASTGFNILATNLTVIANPNPVASCGFARCTASAIPLRVMARAGIVHALSPPCAQN